MTGPGQCRLGTAHRASNESHAPGHGRRRRAGPDRPKSQDGARLPRYAGRDGDNLAADGVDEEGTLSIGTRLGEFEIRGLVGVGGFGIVYRAFDHDLEREVAIKEYMPGLLASRGSDGSVQPRGRTHGETFGAGLRSFMLEAKMLARFDHPALVKVFRYWEGNGTAYMVMPLYQGQTLAQTLRQMPAPPGEVWLMGVLVPLLGALETLHAQHIYHRDVSPDNILLLRNGRPVLLDFGAARQVISDRTQTLTAILKPNYAPIEQYAEMPNLRQGPWTDLYALGAVVHASLTGRPPPPAAARTLQDEMVPLPEIGARLQAERGLRYSDAFLNAWQQTLAVRPDGRPQSVEALMRLLGLLPSVMPGFDPDATLAGTANAQDIDPDRTVVVTEPTGGLPRRVTQHPVTRHPTSAPAPVTGLPPATPEVAGMVPRATTPSMRGGGTEPRTGRDMKIVLPDPATPPGTAPHPPTAAAPAMSAPPPAEARTPAPATSASQRGPWLAAAAAVLLLVGAAALLLGRRGGPAPEPAQAAASATPPVAVASQADAPRTPPPIITEEREPPVARDTAAAAMPLPSEPPAAGPKVLPAPQATALPGAASAPGLAASRPDRAALAAARASAAAARAATEAQAASQHAAGGAGTASRPAGPAPASATAPAETAPQSPEAACAGRILIAHAMCIDAQCRKPESAQHPTCVERRRKAEEEEFRRLHRDG